MSKQVPHRGRGAQNNPSNRFQAQEYLADSEYQEWLHQNREDPYKNRSTRYLKVFPKTIVNPVSSPDIGPSWSLNPYQGCEHGCAYCYARNSHEYWGYSAGTDFEDTILYKPRAPQLLEALFQQPRWKPEPIMLSGNTDCYQPLEKKLQITRQLLKVFAKYRHPLGIITKNSLIQRDIDILRQLNEQQLLRVSISLTSLGEQLRRVLEPRTATVQKRLQTIELLAQNDIPTQVMAAPLIPGLNSHEVMELGKAASDAGARNLQYTMVRLNGQVAPVFMDWVRQHFPDRYSKIKHGIEELHGGKLGDGQFGRRIKGEGALAEQIQQTVSLARKKYFEGRSFPDFNCEAFLRLPRGQYSLF